MYIERWRFGKNTTHKRIHEADPVYCYGITGEGATATYNLTIRRDLDETYQSRCYSRSTHRDNVTEHITVHITDAELDKLIEMRERRRLEERERAARKDQSNDNRS